MMIEPEQDVSAFASLPAEKKPTKKKFFLIGGLLFFFVILLTVIFFPKNQEKILNQESATSAPEKTWKVTLSFDTETQQVVLSGLQLQEKTVTLDNRDAYYSPYSIVLSSSNQVALFSSKINITQFLISQEGELTLPKTLPTTLYIPHRTDASNLSIISQGQVLLEIVLPHDISARPQNVLGEACRKLQIVFISENYTDFSEFQKDVADISKALKTTEPYAKLAERIFDFASIENKAPLGCVDKMETCVTNSKILEIGTAKYPTASKFVVLVKNPKNAASLGISSFGGKVSVLKKTTETKNTIGEVARHEVLGHTVGLLYDRYVYKDVAIQKIVENYLASGGPKSNCSNSAIGESFWKTAGVTTIGKGCTSPNLYAPAALSCFPSTDGSPTTVMSRAGCHTTATFDAAERYWLQNNIIPLYTNCDTPPSPTPTPPPPTPTPTVFTSPPGLSGKLRYECSIDPDCQKNSLQLCSLNCAAVK